MSLVKNSFVITRYLQCFYLAPRDINRCHEKKKKCVHSEFYLGITVLNNVKFVPLLQDFTEP